jgi:C4-dicarboxylate-specific signal transduction histidine kinase
LLPRPEADLRAARERAALAERLAAIGALAASVAHEVNNPLTWVTASLGSAREALALLGSEPRAREAAEALADGEDGVRRIAKVVADLRSATRAPARDRRPVDLRGEVETALRLARHELSRRARVVLRLDPVPVVEAGDFQLGQVAVNLLVNAAQALPPSRVGEIRVRTGTGEDGFAELEVEDDGPGVAPEVLPRIFEPFFTTKPAGQGTGLGLSVCRGIVEGLGGTIDVESAPGRGARFRVRLPPARA